MSHAEIATSAADSLQARSAAPVETLRRWMRPRTPRECCDLCGAEIAPVHPHLFEPQERKLSCSCDACALLFADRRGGRFVRVPRRIERLPDFQCSDAQWDALRVPINLAFFFESTPAGCPTAVYPSPAGPTEAIPDAGVWAQLATDNPALATMQADVEALLVNRVGKSRQAFICPIDECYRLVGLVRMHWRGLSGGSKLWAEIDRFFIDLQARVKS